MCNSFSRGLVVQPICLVISTVFVFIMVDISFWSSFVQNSFVRFSLSDLFGYMVCIWICVCLIEFNLNWFDVTWDTLLREFALYTHCGCVSVCLDWMVVLTLCQIAWVIMMGIGLVFTLQIWLALVDDVSGLHTVIAFMFLLLFKRAVFDIITGYEFDCVVMLFLLDGLIGYVFTKRLFTCDILGRVISYVCVVFAMYILWARIVGVSTMVGGCYADLCIMTVVCCLSCTFGNLWIVIVNLMLISLLGAVICVYVFYCHGLTLMAVLYFWVYYSLCGVNVAVFVVWAVLYEYLWHWTCWCFLFVYMSSYLCVLVLATVVGISIIICYVLCCEFVVRFFELLFSVTSTVICVLDSLSVMLLVMCADCRAPFCLTFVDIVFVVNVFGCTILLVVCILLLLRFGRKHWYTRFVWAYLYINWFVKLLRVQFEFEWFMFVYVLKLALDGLNSLCFEICCEHCMFMSTLRWLMRRLRVLVFIVCMVCWRRLVPYDRGLHCGMILVLYLLCRYVCVSTIAKMEFCGHCWYYFLFDVTVGYLGVAFVWLVIVKLSWYVCMFATDFDSLYSVLLYLLMRLWVSINFSTYVIPSVGSCLAVFVLDACIMLQCYYCKVFIPICYFEFCLLVENRKCWRRYLCLTFGCFSWCLWHFFDLIPECMLDIDCLIGYLRTLMAIHTFGFIMAVDCFGLKSLDGWLC
eukprot:gene2977-1959_t